MLNTRYGLLKLTVNQKRKLKQTRTLLIAGILLGNLFVIFSDGFEKLHPFINATIGGILIALVIAILELWVFTGGVRKIKFIKLLTLRTLLYLFLITLILFNVMAISRMVRYDYTYLQTLTSAEFQNYIFKEDFPIVIVYTLAFAFSINFTRMLSRKMGQGMLLSHITGAYYKPVIQERIIMFLNIENSKQISEKLSPMVFHNFLNDFFYDITESIVMHQGIIYEYVEDLVVVTWAMSKGLKDGNCIRIFFHIQDELTELKEKYFNKYGLFPRIRASLHCGKLVRAEIGEIKTQIVFHGDVMNTTARILDNCYKINVEFLASAYLILRMDIPKIYEINSVGTIALKGKETTVELFEITEKELVTI